MLDNRNRICYNEYRKRERKVNPMKINNMPTTADNYKYIIVREVDGEMWYYGADNDRDRANEVALAVGGIVLA